MEKHTLTFDNTPQASKPTDVAAISNRLTTWLAGPIEELSKAMVQPYGYTWTPALFKGKRSNANWLRQSCFALDFDSGIEPSEVIETLTGYGIVPNIVYNSFSDKPELRKFRVVMFVDEVVDNASTAKFIQLNLMRLFSSSCDVACKDGSRLFYGGKECLHLNTTENSLTGLIEILNTVAVASDSGKVRGCVNLVQKGEFLYNTIGTPLSGQLFNDGKQIEDFDFQQAYDEVQIFRDFIDGKWLTHPQLFGIATNMMWVEGGEKMMRAQMEKVGKYTQNNFSIFSYIRNRKYMPQSLVNFSPYTESHVNIISAARNAYVPTLAAREPDAVDEKRVIAPTTLAGKSLNTGFKKW